MENSIVSSMSAGGDPGQWNRGWDGTKPYFLLVCLPEDSSQHLVCLSCSSHWLASVHDDINQEVPCKVINTQFTVCHCAADGKIHTQSLPKGLKIVGVIYLTHTIRNHLPKIRIDAVSCATSPVLRAWQL